MWFVHKEDLIPKCYEKLIYTYEKLGTDRFLPFGGENIVSSDRVDFTKENMRQILIENDRSPDFCTEVNNLRRTFSIKKTMIIAENRRFCSFNEK